MMTNDKKMTDKECLESCIKVKIDKFDKPVRSFMGRIRIEALQDNEKNKEFIDSIIKVCGWTTIVRVQGKGRVFINLSDGSHAKPLQVVVETNGMVPELIDSIKKMGVAFSLKVVGKLVISHGRDQLVEILVDGMNPDHEIEIMGENHQSEYPLATKIKSIEFLRKNQGLRPRSFFFSAIMRVRSALAFATHDFFRKKGFYYIHTPIITSADCEGAGEMFQVSTIMPGSNKIKDIPQLKDGSIDYSTELFGKSSFLTVSGQLAIENFCCAMCDVYSFGPTFRAEKSHTSRHLAEFWMIEPEMAFADLNDLMECATDYLKHCLNYVLLNNLDDLKFLEDYNKVQIVDNLQTISKAGFAKYSYTECIEILKSQPENTFSVKPYWGMDLGSEHERFLVEKHFGYSIIVYNYPKEIKAFYMKLNDDNKTVRAMDVLVPQIGEIIGGSQREDNFNVLQELIKAKNLKIEDYAWYLDLRKYGSVTHSGFGLGFERLIMMCTGVDNIRDVIPFPRYPGNVEF